ncbi:hypothetical protein GJ496_007186 [Pomphorhynchus laevis]|nr:hypothetical protein GJ496_007186 [Pomphorhynchus laevis]
MSEDLTKQNFDDWVTFSPWLSDAAAFEQENQQGRCEKPDDGHVTQLQNELSELSNTPIENKIESIDLNCLEKCLNIDQKTDKDSDNLFQFDYIDQLNSVNQTNKKDVANFEAFDETSSAKVKEQEEIEGKLFDHTIDFVEECSNYKDGIRSNELLKNIDNFKELRNLAVLIRVPLVKSSRDHFSTTTMLYRQALQRFSDSTQRRWWKPVCLRLQHIKNQIKLFANEDDGRMFTEVDVRPNFKISDIILRQQPCGILFVLKIFEEYIVDYPQSYYGASSFLRRILRAPIKDGAGSRRTHIYTSAHHTITSEVIKLASTSYAVLDELRQFIDDAFFNNAFEQPNFNNTCDILKGTEIVLKIYVKEELRFCLNSQQQSQSCLIRINTVNQVMNEQVNIYLGINDMKRKGGEVVCREDIVNAENSDEWCDYTKIELSSFIDQIAFKNDGILKYCANSGKYLEIARLHITLPPNYKPHLCTTSKIIQIKSVLHFRLDLTLLLSTMHKYANNKYQLKDVVITITIPSTYLQKMQTKISRRQSMVQTVTNRRSRKGIGDMFQSSHSVKLLNSSSCFTYYKTIGRVFSDFNAGLVIWRVANFPRKNDDSFDFDIAINRDEAEADDGQHFEDSIEQSDDTMSLSYKTDYRSSSSDNWSQDSLKMDNKFLQTNQRGH